MNEIIQNIIVFILFVLSIWNLIKYFSNTLKSDGCSSSCGQCGVNTNALTKMKVKKLKV